MAPPGYASAYASLTFDVEERIRQLQSILDENKQPEHRKNIETAIQLYQSGRIRGRSLVDIQDGKVLERYSNLDMTLPIWTEGRHMQLVHREAYSGDTLNEFHEISIKMRLVPRWGGDGREFACTILNDTGSNTLTVFDTDLVALGAHLTLYFGYGPLIPISTANGTVMRQKIWVETKLVHQDGREFSNWILEDGIIMPQTDDALRLSGRGIRKELYFATAPGNGYLYVAEAKNGIVTQLPAV